MKLLKEANAELKEIAQIIKDKGYGRINCKGTIYPGTKVVMGNEILTVTDPLKNVSLFFDDEEHRISVGTTT